MNSIVLIGGGGHCRSCIDVIETEKKFNIIGIIDKELNVSSKILNYPVLGDDEKLAEISEISKYALVTIGQIKSPSKRIEKFTLLKRLGMKCPVIIAPSAYVSPHVLVEEGSIIMNMAVANAGASIGKNCIINSQALVEHDVFIGNNTHISTGVKINGSVNIADNCFIGSGSIITEGVSIGKNSCIGAGQIIKRDVHEGSIIK